MDFRFVFRRFIGVLRVGVFLLTLLLFFDQHNIDSGVKTMIALIELLRLPREGK